MDLSDVGMVMLGWHDSFCRAYVVLLESSFCFVFVTECLRNSFHKDHYGKLELTLSSILSRCSLSKTNVATSYVCMDKRNFLIN